MTWTDDKIEMLKRMWDENATARTIAETIGVTRNSVLGKAHRLKLPRHAIASSPKAYRPKLMREKKMRRVGNKFKPHVVVSKTRIPPRLPPEQFPLECRPVTLMDLDSSHCRWPIGDAREEDFRFCGGERKPCDPYCPHHMEMAYYPSSNKRAQKFKRHTNFTLVRAAA